MMTGITTLTAIIAAGAFADVRVAEVQGPGAILFGAGYVLGAAHPDGAWRRALALGLAMPLAHVVARLTGTALPYQVDDFAITLLGLVPSFVGTLLGVASRRLLRPSR